MDNKINVLVVDDSALVRRVLEEVLSSDPGIQVVGTANDPYAAVEKMRQVAPDVIVLDVEMPKMDGITFLRKLMQQHPIPTVICSTLVESSSDTAVAALEAGAVELILKPTVGTKQFLEESRIRICDVVKAAARARLRKHVREPIKPATPKLTADAVIAKPQFQGRAMAKTTQKVVAVGASTGGTEALRDFLQALPVDAPGIVIVQHMPEGFTASFAKRLNETSAIEVKEAADGDTVLAGRALIARGNHHMVLQRSGARYYVELREGPLVSRHRPSVDVLFRSTAACAGKNAVGVIMTGMGDDGAQGLLEMRNAGAYTIGQDEESCVVYGMPAEAAKRGAVVRVLPLPEIAGAVVLAARE